MTTAVVTPTKEEIEVVFKRFGAVMNQAGIDIKAMFEQVNNAFRAAGIFKYAFRHPGSKTYAQEVCSCCKGKLRLRTSMRSQYRATVPCRRCVARP